MRARHAYGTQIAFSCSTMREIERNMFIRQIVRVNKKRALRALFSATAHRAPKAGRTQKELSYENYITDSKRNRSLKTIGI